MTSSELKAIVDPIVAAIQLAIGERGSVIVMVSSANGPHDSYDALQDLIRFPEKI